MSKHRFPEHIQNKITKEFLTTLKEQLDKVFYMDIENFTKESRTYWNFYQWYDTTSGFETALENACKQHNLLELAAYIDKLEYYKHDGLTKRLTEMLYEHEIIELGNIEDAMSCPYDNFYD